MGLIWASLFMGSGVAGVFRVSGGEGKEVAKGTGQFCSNGSNILRTVKHIVAMGQRAAFCLLAPRPDNWSTLPTQTWTNSLPLHVQNPDNGSTDLIQPATVTAC